MTTVNSTLFLNIQDEFDIAFFETTKKLQRCHIPTTALVADRSVAMSIALKIIGVKLESELTFANSMDDIVEL